MFIKIFGGGGTFMKKKYVAPSVEIYDFGDEVLLSSENFGNANDDWTKGSYWDTSDQE